MKTTRVKNYLLKYSIPRRLVQFLSFMFLSAILFDLGTLALLLPVLWTWGLQTNTAGDAFTAIQLMLYTPVFPWLAFASFLLVGVLIGKSLCGWVCPFGFILDLVDFIKHKKKDLSARTHENMLYGKYLVLGLVLFISATFSITKAIGIGASYESALGIFSKVPFTALSPSETLFATVPKMIQNFRFAIVDNPVLTVLSGVVNLPFLFWIQLVIMVGVLLFSVWVPRGWCRYLCPHGAIMAILSKFSFIGLRRDPVKCSKGGCRQCVSACPMRVPILDLPWEKFSHPECIYCMKCADACKDKAIRPTYP